MSRLEEVNQEIKFASKLAENNLYDSEVLTVTFLMDIAKSLAMIADAMTESTTEEPTNDAL